jgi:hypothetical protein
MNRPIEQWLQWHRRLEAALDLPCPAFITSSEPKMFVLVHQVYDPREVEPTTAGLICDVRQENRPMLIPLAEMEFDAEAPADAVLSAYRDWRTAAS